MSWVVVGVGGAGLLVGGLNAAEQRKEKKQELLANAAQIQYSPWTGMKSNVQGFSGTPSTAMGALQGGVAGAMFGSQFKNAGGSAAKAAPQTEAGYVQPQVGDAAMDPENRNLYASLGHYKY